MSPKALLITGATGQQGSAVIRALLSLPLPPTYSIIALTRSAKSKAALALPPSVSVIEGDLSDPAAIFASTGPVFAVFSVQIASPGSNTEETQGKALIDAAAAHGVQHIVQASGDRGSASDSDATTVSNFRAKFNIEKHLQRVVAAGAGSMSYTILRPVTFFENLRTDIHGRGFARLWAQLGDKGLQMVATDDIGWFGAQALLRSHEEAFMNRAISIAGDELTQAQAAVVFREVVGREMPMAPCLVGTGLKVFKKEALGDMFEWFAEVGYDADVEECARVKGARMMDFRMWLEQSDWMRT